MLISDVSLQELVQAQVAYTRALQALLESAKPEDPFMTLPDISKKTGLNLRHLRYLADHGFVTAKTRGLYSLKEVEQEAQLHFQRNKKQKVSEPFALNNISHDSDGKNTDHKEGDALRVQ